MNLGIFLSVLLVFCGRSSNGASIGDGVAVEEVRHSEVGKDGLVPLESQLEVLESEPVVVPDEIIRMEAEEPRAADMTLLNEEVPYDLDNIEEETFPMDVAPVLSEQENCEIPKEIVDEESAVRAERQADEDLLKALNNVLNKKETLEDVINSESLSLV